MRICIDLGELYDPKLEGSASRCGKCLAAREKTRNQRPSRKAYSSPAYLAQRKLLIGRPCYVDGCTTPADTVDHIIPLRFGGDNGPHNLRPACRSHNSKWRENYHERPDNASENSAT